MTITVDTAPGQRRKPGSALPASDGEGDLRAGAWAGGFVAHDSLFAIAGGCFLFAWRQITLLTNSENNNYNLTVINCQ